MIRRLALATLAALAAAAAAPAAEADARPGRLDRGKLAEALFNHLDADGDGTVTRAELKSYQDALADRAFRRLDRNGDGVISPEEHRGSLSRPRHGPRRG